MDNLRPEPEAEPSQPFGGIEVRTEINVLIVDNSESDRAIYSRYLQSDLKKTYRIIEAATLEKGLELWRSRQSDIVLIDLNFHDGDGLEFLEAINIDRLADRVPVIVLTDQEHEKMAARALKFGAADYLIKGDITAKLLIIAVRQVLQDAVLSRQLLRSQQQQILIAEIALRVREFTDLDDISKAIVKEVRQFIGADRATIYKFNPADMSGKIVAEDIVSPWQPCLNVQVQDTCFRENLGGAYCEGRVFAANDIYAANLTACHIKLLERFQVRANLVVPILLPNDRKRILWGLLILHQCSAPRVWLESDIQLLQQLSVQLAISIKQAIAYQQVQTELIERQRVEALLLNQQADLEDRNELLERTSEELQCTIEELRVTTEEQVAQHRRLEYEQYRYQNLFDFAPDGYLVTDLSGKISEANQAVLELLAISYESLLGKPLIVFVTSDNRDFFYNQLNHFLSPTNVKTNWEIMLRSHQGAPFPAEITVTKNINPLSNEIQLFWMIRNISDRKQAENTLRHIEQLFREAQSIAKIGNWRIDLVNDSLYWSDEVFRIFEIDPQQFGASYEAFLNAIHPDDRDMVDRIYTKSLRDRIPYEVVHRLQMTDGRIKYVQEYGIASYSEDGLPIVSQGTVQDITILKEAEQTLQQLNQSLETKITERTQELWQINQLLQTVLDAFPLAVFWKDRQSLILGCNQLFAITCGMKSPAEAIGKSNFDFSYTKDEALAYLADDRQVMESGLAKLNIEEKITLASGEQQWLQTNKIPLRDSEGNVIGVMGTFQDISDRKFAEKALQQQLATIEAAIDGIAILQNNKYISPIQG